MAIVSACMLRRFYVLRRKDPSAKKGESSSSSSSQSSSARNKAGASLASLRKKSLPSAPTNSTSTVSSALPEDLCRRFSFADIGRMTKKFRADMIITVGGSSTVYKGYSKGWIVAIKRLNHEFQMKDAQKFRTEVRLLAQVRHPNLVLLKGFCADKEEMMVVYEYMRNGPLRDHLYGTNKNPLSWKQRLDICIGAAQGLQYLHSFLKHTIIHRKVSTTTILLDEFFKAKITGFGQSRIMKASSSNAPISRVIKGTPGYVDPEYANHGKLTEKSDVYSFGVVLLEALCARPPVNENFQDERKILVHWFRRCLHKNELNQIMDPYLSGKIKPESLRTFVDLAECCLLDDGMERPSMCEVAHILLSAKGLQET